MTDFDPDRLEERLRAVERSVTGDQSPADLGDAAELSSRADDADERIADLEERVDELEASVEALRGYVGAVQAVNDDVERRAELALARTERAAGPARHPVPERPTADRRGRDARGSDASGGDGPLARLRAWL